MKPLTPAELDESNIVAFLGDIFQRRGDQEYLGEPVTLSQHMLQGATLAQQNHEDEDLIIAALLHDIGHFTSEFGTFSMQDQHDRHHEEAGAKLLERFFPPLITDCVRFHVAAKRYLCATDQGYLKKLSHASIHSLNLQGGPMLTHEVTQFERLPDLEKIIKVRLLDDAGKQKDMPTPDFWYFAPMIQRLVDQAQEER